MKNHKAFKLFSILLIFSLLLPEFGQLAFAYNAIPKNSQYSPPSISLPFVLQSTMAQFDSVPLSSFQDSYVLTPLLTGLDFSIHLNGSDLLAFGVANASSIPPPDANFTASLRDFFASMNDSSSNVLSVVITINSFNGSDMMYSSAYRNFLDIAMEWAETTSDAFILLANDRATPTNMMELLYEAQASPYISEINIVILTHGVMTNDTHGLMMWGNSSPIVVPSHLLYAFSDGSKLSKLNFVFLPFCSMDDEYAAFGSNSVEGFFQSLGAKEIVGGKGEITLDSEYLSWVQDILLGGYWTDDYSYVEIPVFDNSSGEWVTLVFTTYSEVNESELPLVQGNASTLGIYSYRGRRRVPRGHYTTLTRRVSVSVAVKKGHSRTVVHRTSVKKVGSAKWHHTAARAKKSMCSGSLLKKSRVIKTNNGRMMIPRHRTRPIHSGSSSSSSSLSSSSSSASSSSSSDYSSKISKYKREIEKAKRTALSSFVIADKVISKIYGGYIAAKNKLKSAIYAAFNWAWGWPASSIWAAIEGHVLKGVDWLLSKISQDHKFKSLISVAYNMIKAGKSGWELAIVLIGWGVAKFASGILHYFGNIASWLLSKFGDAGKWVIKLMRGWTDSALSFVDSKLAYFEETLKKSLASMVQSINDILLVLVEVIKDKAEDIIKAIIKKAKNITAFSKITELTSIVFAKVSEITKTIDEITMAINVAQAVMEVATAGIGAVVTRILLPLVAAMVVNQLLPVVVKQLTGLTISVKPMTIDDVITVITGGLGGLVKFIVPRILSIVMSLSLLNFLKEKLKDFGITDIGESNNLVSTLISAVFTFTAVKTVKSLTKTLGSNVSKVFDKLDSFISSAGEIFDSAGKPKSSKDKIKTLWNQAVATAKNLQKSYEQKNSDRSTKSKSDDDSWLSAISAGIVIALYYLITFFFAKFLVEIGTILPVVDIPIVEGTLKTWKSSLVGSLFFAGFGTFVSLIVEPLLDLIPSDSEFREYGKMAQESVRGILDGSLATVLAIDDITELMVKTHNSNNKVAGWLKDAFSKAVSGLKTVGKKLHLQRVSNFFVKYFSHGKGDAAHTTANVLVALIFLALAIRSLKTKGMEKYANLAFLSISGVLLIEKTKLSQLLQGALKEIQENFEEEMQETKNADMDNTIKSVKSKIEESKEEENKVGLLFQVIGDVGAIGVFIYNCISKMNELEFAWTFLVLGILGIGGDIVHDDKISYFDLMSAFYIGYDAFALWYWHYSGIKHEYS